MDYRTQLLSTRPYSWINAVLIGLATHFFVLGNLSVSFELALTGYLALLSWITGQTIPDYLRKKHEYGENAVLHLRLLPSALLLVSVAYLGGLPAVAAFFALTASILLYAAKVKSRFFGHFSFLTRGFAEVSLVILVFTSYGGFPSTAAEWSFIAAVYLVTGSRNIVGDLRDVGVDGNTLASSNFRLAQFISVVFAGTSLFLVPDLLVMLPVLLAMVLTAVYGRENAYTIHRIYVICTMFFLFQYLVDALAPELLILTNLVFLGTVLNFTYPYVPRKLNKISEEPE